MQTLCQFAKIKMYTPEILLPGMKWHKFFASFLIFFLTLTPIATVFAQVKPDMRTYDQHVITIPMPTVECLGLSPEDWIRKYIGFNQLSNNTMLFPAIDQYATQADRVAKRTTSYIVYSNLIPTTQGPGNSPCWVGSICWYRASGNGQIIAKDAICGDNTITNMIKTYLNGMKLLAATYTRESFPMTNGVYNATYPAVTADPFQQQKCPATPPGENQGSDAKIGEGYNTFWNISDLIRKIACGTPTDPCECEDTAMYIKTSSFVPYLAPGKFQTDGGTAEQNQIVDKEVQADENTQNGGGVANALARAGIQPFIWKIIADISGKVLGQKTVNNIKELTGPASYVYTNEIETSWVFMNCKFSPFSNRSDQCNRNWFTGTGQNVSQL